MTTISFYRNNTYSAAVYEGDTLVDTIAAASMTELKRKVKKVYRIKVI